MNDRIYLNDLGIVCALGRGKPEVAARLFAGDVSGMMRTDRYSAGCSLTVGETQSPLPDIPLSAEAYQSRNNRLLLAAVEELGPSIRTLLSRHDPGRIGVVVGTSTSGMAEAEAAIAQYGRTHVLSERFHLGQLELGNSALFLAELLGLRGPSYTVSTACSSGAKALGSAMRLIRSGLCDAVLAGGGDSLCRFTVAGFSALEAISPERCNPFSANRKGINIGEGAALFVVSREPGGVELLGVGESSDAHHISAPDPSGRGASLAMAKALAQAGLQTRDVGYLNLHGTATIQNDAMEARAVNELFGDVLPCSSTKPLTGHALGAAGAVEAGFCWLTLSGQNPERRVPPHVWDGVHDPRLAPICLCALGKRVSGLRYALSNSFAFGGSNVCVAFGAV